jgi:hypothetical protein
MGFSFGMMDMIETYITGRRNSQDGRGREASLSISARGAYNVRRDGNKTPAGPSLKT